MFLVVHKWNGKVQFSKDEIDPRSRQSYKEDKQRIVDIISLTPLGEDQELSLLRSMWVDGVFDRPSPFKEKEKLKPPPIRKPPKELMGPKE